MSLALGVATGNAQTPPGDDFGGPEFLSGDSGSVTGTLAGATPDAGQPDYTAVGEGSVWYDWTPIESGIFTFELNIPSRNAIVVIYSGATLPALQRELLFDTPVSSITSFIGVAGNSYKILVLGENADYQLTWYSNEAQASSRSAGQVRFGSVSYTTGEFESSLAPFTDASGYSVRSPRGAVLTVVREGGTTGRIAVDYTTMEEVGGNVFMTPVASITSVTNGPPNTFTNFGTFTFYYTNAYQLSSNFAFTNFYRTNWISTANFCSGTETNCLVTNETVRNCSPGFISQLSRTPLQQTQFGCAGVDYVSTSGTLFFDDFETIKKFVVPVRSDGADDDGSGRVVGFGNGDKTVRLELFNQRLVQEELDNPTGIVPPRRNVFGSQMSLDIVESNGRSGGTNFFIEKTTYAIDETNRTVLVDIIHPAGVGGNVRVRVMGVETEESERWSPGRGSDYASGTILTDIIEPLFTDGFTPLPEVQDFDPSSRVLSFPQNETRLTVPVQIASDTRVEFNEDIYIKLESINNNPLASGNTEARITILYDEPPAGALDREWNPANASFTNPRMNPAPGANNLVEALVVQTDNKSVIGGDFTAYNSFERNGIARINTDGSNDDSFNPGTGANGFVAALALYPDAGNVNDGKIVVGGGFTSMNNIQRNGIARLNVDGSLDASFNPGAGVNGTVRSVAIQSDGKIVIAGEFSEYNGVARNNIARLNDDGSLDAGFNTGSGTDGIIWSVVVAETPSRKIFIGGEFLEVNGTYRGNVARLNENGSLDTSYDSGGGADGPVYAMAAMSDGRLIIGGYFDSLDFTSRPRIARLLGTGGLDTSFNPGTGANDAIYSVTLQTDDKILVGGLFTVFNQTRRVGLARLFVNGSVDTSFLDTAYNHFAGLVNDYGYQPPNYVNAIGVQSDGAVLIGGSFYQAGGNFAGETNFDPDLRRGANWPFDPYIVGDQMMVWSRADKQRRSNVARLMGGQTPGPGNVGFVLPQVSADEHSGSLTIPFSRTDGRLGTVGATTSSENGLAVAGVDFTGGQAQPIWRENYYLDQEIAVGFVLERLASVSLINDSNIEGDETFGMNLMNPFGSLSLGGFNGSDPIPIGTALGQPESIATITDNDFNHGVLAFSSATYYTNENISSMRITVVRTNGSDGLISVRYYTYNGSAIKGADYTNGILETLSFGQGETSKTISIPLSNDNTVEADEDFFIVLTNATGGSRIYSSNPLGNTATNSVTARAVIIDNDLASGRANFASATFSTPEGAGTALITLQRLGGSVGQLQVNVAASAGTAANSVDFTGATNTVVWVNGDVTPKTVAIALLDDSAVEGNETVNLQLVSPFPTGATGSVNTATLTIADDDFYGSLSFSQEIYDADERGTNVTITVVRTGGLGGTVSVNYSTADGSGSNPAVNPVDYLSASGTLTFGPGVMATNFDVTVVNNGLEDDTRTLALNLFGFVNATAGNVPTADLRILDDESVGDPAGSLDTTFTPLAGSSNSIYSLAIQPDGKLLAGGEFRTLNRSLRNRVGRLNPDGTLDMSFNPRGGPNGTVRSMALQSDGRLVIGGFFTSIHSTNRNRIARLLADGSVDRFFNPGAGADNPVYAVALSPDGRIAVGGSFTTMNGIPRSGIVLLETNGTVSTTFNPGLGAAGTVFAIAVQPDGKIIIGGDFESVNGSSYPRLARLNLNGSVDTTFDVGTGPDGTVRAIVLQPDGRILIGGSFTDVNGTGRSRLARLTFSGAVDNSFLAAVDGADGDVNAIALQYDSKVIVAGEFSRFNGVSRRGITRLYRTGKTDPTINFGRGANDAVNAVAIQTDRKMVLGGRFTSYDGQVRSFLARIHGGSIAGAGAMEFTTPFYEILESGGEALITVQRRGGTTGDVTVDYQTLDDTALAGADYTAVGGTLTFLEAETFQSFTVPILNDTVGEPNETVGLILTNAASGAILGAVPNAYLSIFNDDSGIGYSSSSYTVNEGAAGNAATITVLRTGSTVGTATVGYRTADGSAVAGQDYTAQAGLLTFAPGVSSLSFSVAVADDSLIESSETFSLVLSNATGSAALSISSATVTIVDNDFRAGNLTFSAPSYSVAESGGTLNVVVLRTNGSTGVLSVDYSTVDGSAIGGVDFVLNSGNLTFVEGQTSQTITLTILDDGVVEGDESFFVELFNPGNGTVISGLTNVQVTVVDEEFGPGSLDRNFDPGAGANDIVRSLSVQPDGRILAGGAFTSFGTGTNRFVTRLASTGANDPAFNVGSGPNGLVTVVAATADQRVMVVGGFTEVNGSAYKQVARLGTNGLPDLTFNDNVGFNGSVSTLAVESDGRFLLGGAFGLPTRGLVRLRLDGTVDTAFVPGAGLNGPVHSVLVQTDGRVIVGGTFTTADGATATRVARFHTDGSLDVAFNVTAITNGTVYALALQSDGRIVVGGDFKTSASGNAVRLARLGADGTLDSGFAVGTGANGVVFALGVNSSNQIVVGGDFTTINGTTRNRFARLHSNGALDTGFDPGPGANGTVYTLAVLPGDDILIGGNFTTVNGAVRNRVARILGGGVALGPVASAAAAGGQIRLRFSAVAGKTYRLESSANLTQWQAVSSQVSTGPAVEWLQPMSATSSARFYRVLVLP